MLFAAEVQTAQHRLCVGVCAFNEAIIINRDHRDACCRQILVAGMEHQDQRIAELFAEKTVFNVP